MADEISRNIVERWVWSLRWRHNGCDSVSNNQPRDCLLSRLFRRRSKKTWKLRVTGLCVGNSPGQVNSPHKGPVTRKMFPFDDVIMILKFMFLFRLCWQWIDAEESGATTHGAAGVLSPTGRRVKPPGQCQLHHQCYRYRGGGEYQNFDFCCGYDSLSLYYSLVEHVTLVVISGTTILVPYQLIPFALSDYYGIIPRLPNFCAIAKFWTNVTPLTITDWL